MNTVFGSVAYSSAWKYRMDFIDSLNKQSDTEFDIMMINDNIDDDQIRELSTLSDRKTNIFKKPYSMSISKLRVYLIYTAKMMGYDLLVLGDFDDKFHSERIKNIKKQYDDNYGFYYHQLAYFDGTSVFKSMPSFLNNFREILDFNMLGLSNTAINLNQLSVEFIESLSEADTDIFDWYLYTRLLLNGLEGMYLTDALTYYRIHDSNIAGNNILDESYIKREILVKRKHYKLLGKYADIYQERLNQFQNITDYDYSHMIHHDTSGYWWGKIRP